MINERYQDVCTVCNVTTWMQDDDEHWTVACESCGTEWARDEDAYFEAHHL